MRTYAQALDYLEQFINYERQRSAPYSPETLSLDRVHDLLKRLGDPHRAYPTIHVAGTKGKGSTCAMIESILRAAGCRTGLYTSPHLHTFRERMRVCGELISREAFAALVDEIEPHVAAAPGLTWFEIVTALGFLHFARSRIDIGVIEVGLGGRFDATNVITPQVSVITSLSLDHTAWLGDTLDKIAFEKAGIIKPGVPVVSAPQKPEALAVIERIATERGAPLTVIGRSENSPSRPVRRFASGARQARLHPLKRASDTQKHQENGESFTLRGKAFHVPLRGRHQIDNAVLAIAAVRQAKGFSIGDETIRRGLNQVEWPGRFEIARGDPPLVFDGAHNVDSALRLVATLEEVFPDRRWTLVFGASSDKDIAGILDALLPCVERAVVTRARSVRAANLESIAQQIAERGKPVEIAPSVAQALARILDSTTPVVVTGSLYIVAEAREAWLDQAGLPMPERDA